MHFFQQNTKKLNAPFGSASGPKVSHCIAHLLIADNNSKQHFLIDTGADVSVLPARRFAKQKTTKTTQLFTTNGTPIRTYGEKRLKVSLNLRRDFIWTFIVADVNSVIIGSSFLKHFGLLVDVKGSKLIDRKTLLEVNGIATQSNAVQVRAHSTQGHYAQLQHEFKDLAIINANKQPITTKVTHHITTKGPPIYARARRITGEKLIAAKKKSEFLIKKKSNGEWRPCGDYRALNDITIADRNAIQTFQRQINEVLKGLDFIFAYIDDILKASNSEEEHEKHLRIVLERLRLVNLAVNFGKCQFGKHELIFLGHNISTRSIKPSEEKVNAVRNFPKTKIAKQLKTFFGMINFYRSCIPKATKNQQILQQLIFENAFEECKSELANATLLNFMAPNTKLTFTTDTSDEAVGSVLQQVAKNQVQPLGFYSKKLTPPQKNYSAYDRELTAIYQEIKHFKYVLEGKEFVTCFQESTWYRMWL
ncbi:uncharacterized protein LOC119666000 [Teleopsis dalmanni]|uniref:uncharacterized protein LOC119666000 n=1 Tax=Teleopsis dalmanni TaxID=139649 RepID=UPI0018CF2C45|nr:uncharacterized protein LOC119666000 [Teleopsis dalmanni]